MEAQLLCTNRALQDGGHSHDQRPPRPGDCMDDKSLPERCLPHYVYLMILVATDHRKLLQFKWLAVAYQFNCLPFGLSSALWVFTKTAKLIVAIHRTMGLRITLQGTNSLAYISPGEPGLHHQLPKVHCQTIKEDRISSPLFYRNLQSSLPTRSPGRRGPRLCN